MFSRVGFILALLLWSGWASALNINAVYLASCRRELGLVVGVDGRHVQFLTLEGVVKNIERYEIIYIATYPVDTIPIRSITNTQYLPQKVLIKTMSKFELVNLVEGWPIDFSRNKISFLTTAGTEVVIDRSSLWQIEYSENSKQINFDHNQRYAYQFVHPYAFDKCPNVAYGASGAAPVRIFPQQLLSDPILIKKEFDRLRDGYALLEKNNREQKFYPVPNVYGNYSSLGLWYTSGSRYGSSNSRSNNFTPVLTDEYSSGPFGFQQIFITGSAPIANGIHLEPQTQVFYRFKADYFHFSFMLDPSLLLVGSYYNWQKEELNDVDTRLADTAFAELGFDWGAMSLDLTMASGLNAAARLGDRFAEEGFSVSKVGVTYHGYKAIVNVAAINGSRDPFSLSGFRGNLTYLPNEKTKLMFSFMNKVLKYDPSDAQFDRFLMESQGTSFGFYGYYDWTRRYTIGGLVVAEQLKYKYGVTNQSSSSSRSPISAGAMISLKF